MDGQQEKVIYKQVKQVSLTLNIYKKFRFVNL